MMETALVPYVPGDFTDIKHRDPSYEFLAKYRSNQQQILKDTAELRGYPSLKEDFTRCALDDTEKKTSKQLTEEFYQKHKNMMCETFNKTQHSCYNYRKDKRLMSPIRAAIKNFDLAKKFHKENLEHQPLPDTVTDAMYRKLQMQGHREPGLALKEGNYAAGVAWKAFAGYGPTRCTKLKVFRPKTSICNKIKDSANDRPSSVSSFDRKWRFIRQKKVTPIQLAVCWDITPVNAQDEPKRTPHIDGSNGSLAPAVFSLVHSPKVPPDEEEPKCDGLHTYSVSNAQQQGSSRESTQSSCTTEKSKRSQSAPRLYSANPNSVFTKLDTVLPDSPSQKSYCSRECYQKNEILENRRLCMACEMKNINIRDTRPKSEFKMAFKAGVPQKVSTTFIKLGNILKVPRMKVPYKERNYSINSLAPPFSLQNLKRQDYPEHWRLATVYQHSYKPIQARKRPFLSTVFK